MVITEIFYLANKSEIQNKFKFQNDILKVSKADTLAEIKEFDKIFESDENTNFYNQQISIMCISDEINDLSRKVSLMSQGLSKLGIIHVKEDILLENAYWSQVPGNFNFLKRVYLNTKSQICAFASLENVHFGRKSSKLGKAITILRTNKGTPYFFNFHDKSGNGNTIIIGKKKSGKTVITNFLISETTKYQPTILYLHADDSPTVFIKSIGGELLSNIDQFNQLNSLSSIELIKKSLTLMLLGYDTENSKDYENIINALAQYCFDNEHPKFQEFSNKYNATNEAEIKIKQYLEFFGQNEYEKFFIKNNNQYFKSQTITGVALNSFQNEIFKKNHFSEDEKDLNLYSMKLKLNNNFKNMLAVSLINEFCNIDDSGIKIIVFDDLLKIFSADSSDVKIFNEMLSKFGSENDEWIKALYLEYNK
jgi:type IV secretion system protein VirB4